MSGNVRLATRGPARAASVSGDIDATFGESSDDEMNFASVSGSVILRIGSGVNADVRANTLSGEIESDFPLERDDDDDDDEGGFHIRIGEQARGRIGRGGPELSVNTVSGNIRFARMR